MRLLTSLVLAFVAFIAAVVAMNPFATTKGLENTLRVMLEREPTPEEIQQALSTGKVDFEFKDYLEKLEKKNPISPKTTSLRRPSESESQDLDTVAFIQDDPVIYQMGYLHKDQGFVGRTRNGRYVFQAPRREGFSLQVPDTAHGWTEHLTARLDKSDRGYLQHHGWSKSLGFGPWDELRNIAIQYGKGEFLLKDEVPINRMTMLRYNQLRLKDPEERLGRPMRTNLMS